MKKNDKNTSSDLRLDMKDKLMAILDLPCNDSADFDEAVAMGLEHSQIDYCTTMLIGLYNKAKSGNVPAFREVISILDEKQQAAELNQNNLVNAWLDAVVNDNPQEITPPELDYLEEDDYD